MHAPGLETGQEDEPGLAHQSTQAPGLTGIYIYSTIQLDSQVRVVEPHPALRLFDAKAAFPTVLGWTQYLPDTSVSPPHP
jgi:hypothetical protein